MTFRVIIQPEAEHELAEAFDWLVQNAPSYAPAWRESLERAVASLKEMPCRCALAPENERFPVELRHLRFGKGRNRYRVVFTVREGEVHVLHVRHSHRRPL